MPADMSDVHHTVPCMHAVGEVKACTAFLGCARDSTARLPGEELTRTKVLNLRMWACAFLMPMPGERLQEVAAGQDAHLQATKGQTLPLQCKDTP